MYEENVLLVGFVCGWGGSLIKSIIIVSFLCRHRLREIAKPQSCRSSIKSFITYFGGKALEHYFPVLLPLEYPGDLIAEYNLVKPYDLRVRDENLYIVTAKDGVENQLRRYKLRGREHLAPVLLVCVGVKQHSYLLYFAINSSFILFSGSRCSNDTWNMVNGSPLTQRCWLFIGQRLWCLASRL